MKAPLIFEKAHAFAYEDRWEWLLGPGDSVTATIYRDGAWEVYLGAPDGTHCLCDHEGGGPEDCAREIERILRCASGAVPK